MKSADRFSSRSRRSARAVWLPAIPTRKPSCRSFSRQGRASGYSSCSLKCSGKSACSGRSRSTARSNPARNCWKVLVILADGDDRAEHGGESVSWDSEPVGPGAVLGGLVDQLTGVSRHVDGYSFLLSSSSWCRSASSCTVLLSRPSETATPTRTVTPPASRCQVRGSFRIKAPSTTATTGIR
jgi:hypothetical protein